MWFISLLSCNSTTAKIFILRMSFLGGILHQVPCSSSYCFFLPFKKKMFQMRENLECKTEAGKVPWNSVKSHVSEVVVANDSICSHLGGSVQMPGGAPVPSIRVKWGICQIKGLLLNSFPHLGVGVQLSMGGMRLSLFALLLLLLYVVLSICAHYSSQCPASWDSAVGPDDVIGWSFCI